MGALVAPAGNSGGSGRDAIAIKQYVRALLGDDRRIASGLDLTGMRYEARNMRHP